MFDIGIIGGAGPLAGALLFEQIITICQKDYGCSRDFDFPSIHLVSFPFSEMLIGNVDQDKIYNELFNIVTNLNVKYFAVACNTLHAFMKENFPLENCVHLLNETKKNLKGIPLVICSKISKEKLIHAKFFPCRYVGMEGQSFLDKIIDLTLEGNFDGTLSQQLESFLIQYLKEIDQQDCQIVLGCTEFSLIHRHYPIAGVEIVDPSFIAAKKLTQNILGKSALVRINQKRD